VAFSDFFSVLGLVRAAARRNEAAGWLRRTVGAVAARDLPEEPSEEEFRVGLRNGQVLCSALNRVHPGAVPKASARFVLVNLLRFPLPLLLPLWRDIARARTRAYLQVVVNTAADSLLQPDGAALSAFQYFENVRNFLVAAQEIGLPCFEASDLEQVRVGEIEWVGRHHLALLAAAANLPTHCCFPHTLLWRP
jgi:kinesin family member C2/C3